MPQAINWSSEMDASLIAGRAARKTWDMVAAEVGVSRNSAIDRFRRLSVAQDDFGFARRVMRQVIVPPKPERPPSFEERPPLCAGHPLAWATITQGTSLAGSAYPFPVYS